MLLQLQELTDLHWYLFSRLLVPFITHYQKNFYCWHSMVLVCSACANAYSSGQLHEGMREEMEKTTCPGQEVKKHVRLQDR